MAKFRKKPVVVEAFQMTKERRWDNSEWPEWLNEAWNKEGSGSLYCVAGGEQLFIDTLSGTIQLNWDDYIIKGAKENDIYPCNPSVFEATYEIVD